MKYEFSTGAATTQQIAQAVIQCLGRLQQKRQLDDAAHDDFAAAHSMLEAMPLSTDQFGLACTRLRNARHYLRYTEPGAARYELQLLASSLNHSRTEREPNRRLRHRV